MQTEISGATELLKGMIQMFRTDDPARDWDRYCAEQEEELERLPRCSECDEPITDAFCYYINGEYICEECMKDNYLIDTPTDDF